jgi:threonine dehydrogenase-like Zn-dependent dehydrogenase
MDASFGTNPLAMSKAIRLQETGLIDLEKVISHRLPLTEIHQAIEIMAGPNRNKVIINP